MDETKLSAIPIKIYRKKGKLLSYQNILSFPWMTQKAIHSTDSEHKSRAKLKWNKYLINV